MGSGAGRTTRRILAVTLGTGACVVADVGGASSQEITVEDGATLATRLGCAGCHDGLGDPSTVREVAPVLGPAGDPLAAEFVFSYLADPEVRRPEIAPARMPDFRLSEDQRVALALYLGRGGATAGAGDLAGASERQPDATASAGRALFAALGCAGCHEHAEVPSAPVGPDLTRVGARTRPEWLGRWLRDPGRVRPAGHVPGSGSRMPDFRLSDAEADALVAHLSSLGAGAGAAWAPEPLSPARQARAERLLEGRFGCLGCHRLGEDGGRVGPPLDGLVARLRPGFVREMLRSPSEAAPGSAMPAEPMREADVDLVARYLLGRDGEWNPVDAAGPSLPPVASSADDEGGVLYARHCASCHGAEGRGDGWNAAHLPVPPTVHADSTLMSRRADDTLFDGIYGGGWVLDRSARMPPFGRLLTSDQIRSLVRHIRVLCRCEGPDWSRGGADAPSPEGPR